MVAEPETVKRRIRDLRVVDLRNELDSRGLDKTGVKATLVERLMKALQDEGHNPEEHFFDSGEKKNVKRGSQGGKPDHDTSDWDSCADGADVSNANEFDEDVKEDPNKDMPPTEHHEVQQAPPQVPIQEVDATAANQENNDAVEDCINLNLEDEENFDEEEHHAKDKDDQAPRRGGGSTSHHREEATKSSTSSTGGSGGATSSGEPTSSKESSENSTAGNKNVQSSGSGGDHGDRQGTHEDNKNLDSSDTATSSSAAISGGEKAKSGSTISKDASKITSKDDRDKKKTAGTSTNNGNSSGGGGSSSRNLWVSGLATNTRATDLKHVFSKYGKVIGAKVVTNARTPGARCYGYVTMATSEDASKCIQHLHRTELHGRMISVERAKGESGPRKADAKATDSKTQPGDSSSAATTSSVVEKKNGEADINKKNSTETVGNSTNMKKSAEGTAQEAVTSGTSSSTSADPSATSGKEKEVDPKAATAGVTGKDGDKDSKGTGAVATSSNKDRVNRERIERDKNNKDRIRRPPSPHRSRQQQQHVLTFKDIREERDRFRLREREREERESERRRREEVARQREHERKQREEAIRLEKERERLRIERERLEREKAELMRLERERQRLERERIEAEREELKRQQARSLARLEEVRRASKRPAPGDREDYGYLDRKRSSISNVDMPLRYDAPPPPRYSDDPKSGGIGFASVSSDYGRGGAKVLIGTSDSGRGHGYDRSRYVERPPPHAPPAPSVSGGGMTRRIVQEVSTGSLRRDGRAPLPPSPPPPPRDRLDDRRVIDRRGDDRYDRGSRSREAFQQDRDRGEVTQQQQRERERARERNEPVGRNSSSSNRMPPPQDRDHRDRYADSRGANKSGDHRYGERNDTWRPSAGSGGSSNSKNYSGSGMLGNGGSSGNSSGGNNWSAQSGSSGGADRWNNSSSSGILGLGSRSISSSNAFGNNAWPSSTAPPPLSLSNSVYPSSTGNIGSLSSSVLGQSGSVNYANDRYSRH